MKKGKKIVLRTDGLQGANLELVNSLNTRFAELPEVLSQEEIQGEIRGALGAMVDENGKLTINLDALKEVLRDDDQGIRTIVKNLGIAVAELTEKAGQPKDMSLRGQIRAWMESQPVKDAVSRIKAGAQTDIPPFELNLRAAYDMMGVTHRAPATMTVAANAGAYIPTPEIAPGVIDLVRIQPTFWDYLIKGRTNRAAYVWVNKTNKQGNAQFIGEGVLKPLASFNLETEISNAKKIAERMKASTEILEDVEGFASLIEDELRYEVLMGLNTTLLTGTLSSTVPAGITTIASAFTLTGLETLNPNNFDAIRAAVAQIRSLFFYGQITVFVNPIDAATMELTKALDSGVYMLPPFTSADGTRISGARIVEDPSIDQGYILAADLTKFKVLIYKPFTVAWGWENDDFSKNLVTVIGEMRLHSFHSSNHTGAFLYDTFANIKSAIEPGS